MVPAVVTPPSFSFRISTDGGLDWQALYLQLGALVSRMSQGSLREKKQDLLQRSLLKILELEKRQPGRTIWTPVYLSRLVKSLLIDEFRHRARRPEESLDEDLAALLPATNTTSPESRLLSRELGTALKATLDRLAPARRQACMLYLAGFGTREIAEKLGWQTKKTENALFRGLADLREGLATQGFVPDDTSRHITTRKLSLPPS